MDEAFTSTYHPCMLPLLLRANLKILGRMHFKFNYPSLDETSRFKLWKDFLNHLPSGIAISGLNDEDIQAISKHPLNGREVSKLTNNKLKST